MRLNVCTKSPQALRDSFDVSHTLGDRCNALGLSLRLTSLSELAHTPPACEEAAVYERVAGDEQASDQYEDNDEANRVGVVAAALAAARPGPVVPHSQDGFVLPFAAEV